MRPVEARLSQRSSLIRLQLKVLITGLSPPALPALDQVGRRQVFVQRGRQLEPLQGEHFRHSLSPATPEAIPGTDCAVLRYETKSPRPAPGASLHSWATCLSSSSSNAAALPADTEAGSATRAAVRAAAKDVTGGDKLDPKRTVALVVRGVAGLAQRIQAVLRRTRRCGGESRQLEDHPRALIQFRHAEGQGRPFGGHLELGTRSYVGFSGDGEILAIAAENDWRLGR